jgi:hypothetical protein
MKVLTNRIFELEKLKETRLEAMKTQENNIGDMPCGLKTTIIQIIQIG